MTALDEALKNLQRATKRLRAGQTDGRRRAARAHFKHRVRAVLRALDEAFPTPQRASPTKRRGRALLPDGEFVGRSDWLAQAVKAGVRSLPAPTTTSVVPPNALYLPAWFVEACRKNLSINRIIELRKSPKERRLFMARKALVDLS